jgi:hypothetical protein
MRPLLNANGLAGPPSHAQNRSVENFFSGKHLPYVAFLFAAAFFFAHRFFIAIESAFLPAAVRPTFLTGTEALAGGAFGAVAIGAGAAAAAFAARIAAQRFFVPAMIARLPAPLSFRFTGAVDSTGSGAQSGSIDGRTAFRPEPGGLPFRLVGP